MALFMVYGLDDPEHGLERRMANRPAHLAWVRGLGEGVRMAGPVFADDGETFAGSLVVFEAESLEAVRALAAEDPYARAGVFARQEIRPFKWLINPPADL